MLAITNPNRRFPMAKRITRKPALPVAPWNFARRVRELPGAVFYGEPIEPTRGPNDLHAPWKYLRWSITSIDREALLYADRLQRVRASYEKDDGQEMLWHDCQQMGFSPKEISRFIAHPASITNCGYLPAIPLT